MTVEWPEIIKPREGPILTIDADGRLQLGSGVDLDEASRALWDEIIKRFSVRTTCLETVAERAQVAVDNPSDKNIQELREALDRLTKP